MKNYVKKGLILINGSTAKSSNTIINTDEDKIFLCGEELIYEDKIYFMLNKPKGYVSANADKSEKTVMELLGSDINKKNLFVAGRLDKDTEGFVLLTNDGEFAHNILSPKKHVPKTYYALINGFVSEKDVEDFNSGIVLDDGYKCMSAELKILKSDCLSEIELTIHEGKFHQVKRMFISVNKSVEYLKRIKIGNLELDKSLNLGEYKKLSLNEITQISNLKLKKEEVSNL